MSTQILYSTIRPELKKAYLQRGTILGLLGIAIFICMGLSLSPKATNGWGLFGFFASGALITLGLRPYRRLTSLETKPHQLRIEPSGEIFFFYANKPFLMLPAKCIRQLQYRDVKDSYGIVVDLHDPACIRKMNPGLNLETYIASTRRRYGGDVFFPLFSHRSLDTIESLR